MDAENWIPSNEARVSWIPRVCRVGFSPSHAGSPRSRRLGLDLAARVASADTAFSLKGHRLDK